MNNTDYTPIPRPYFADGCRIEHKDYGLVANVRGFKPEAEATAKFIVRACNTHDDLVSALEALLSAPDLNEDSLDNSTLSAIAQAQVSLTLAKVQS